jgi:hypothetical protein
VRVLGRLAHTGLVPTYGPHERMFTGELEEGLVQVEWGPEPDRDGVPRVGLGPLIPVQAFDWLVRVG